LTDIDPRLRLCCDKRGIAEFCAHI
jgi:hypothetical protein